MDDVCFQVQISMETINQQMGVILIYQCQTLKSVIMMKVIRKVGWLLM